MASELTTSSACATAGTVGVPPVAMRMCRAVKVCAPCVVCRCTVWPSTRLAQPRRIRTPASASSFS
jgi:hypothetical protein